MLALEDETPSVQARQTRFGQARWWRQEQAAVVPEAEVHHRRNLP